MSRFAPSTLRRVALAIGVVSIALNDGVLRFEVRDDGAGFDPSSTSFGSGLQGMADRLDAVRGSLQVRSTPGEGTTITGTVTASARSLA